MGHSFTDVFLRQRRVWHCRQVLSHLRTRLRFLEMSSAACSECRHGSPKSQGWQTLSKEHLWLHTWACGFFFSLWSKLKSLSSSFSSRNTPTTYFGRNSFCFFTIFRDDSVVNERMAAYCHFLLLAFTAASLESYFCFISCSDSLKKIWCGLLLIFTYIYVIIYAIYICNNRKCVN